MAIYQLQNWSIKKSFVLNKSNCRRNDTYRLPKQLSSPTQSLLFNVLIFSTMPAVV